MDKACLCLTLQVPFVFFVLFPSTTAHYLLTLYYNINASRCFLLFPQLSHTYTQTYTQSIAWSIIQLLHTESIRLANRTKQ